MPDTHDIATTEETAADSSKITVKTDEPEKNTPQRTRKHRSPMRQPQRFALHCLILITILYFMFGHVFGLLIAPNGDMYPRIDSRDLLLFYRIDRDVKAQDVIVLRKNNTTYVARVVAVSGDTVEVTDTENLIINGNTMIESNIFYSTPRYEGFVEYPLVLEEDECFVLVDKRNAGEDSRYYGPVNKDEILGTVITVVRRNSL